MRVRARNTRHSSRTTCERFKVLGALYAQRREAHGRPGARPIGAGAPCRSDDLKIRPDATLTLPCKRLNCFREILLSEAIRRLDELPYRKQFRSLPISLEECADDVIGRPAGSRSLCPDRCLIDIASHLLNKRTDIAEANGAELLHPMCADTSDFDGIQGHQFSQDRFEIPAAQSY